MSEDTGFHEEMHGWQKRPHNEPYWTKSGYTVRYVKGAWRVFLGTVQLKHSTFAADAFKFANRCIAKEESLKAPPEEVEKVTPLTEAEAVIASVEAELTEWEKAPEGSVMPVAGAARFIREAIERGRVR